MDTSDKYIKMCQAVEEIQELWEFEEGSFYQTRFDESDGEIFNGKTVITALCDSCNVIDSYGSTTVSEYSPKGRYVWLPRQDQLQEIMADYIAKEQEMVKTRTDLMQAFLDFTHWLGTQYYKREYVCLPTNVFSSGEQLWLAFVMKEIYNKVWDGEEWIRQKNM